MYEKTSKWLDKLMYRIANKITIHDQINQIKNEQEKKLIEIAR